MSVDRSLKSASTLTRHRNVLTRAERVVMLEEDGKWSEEAGVLGLPKVGHRKQTVGGKVKKDATEEEAAPAVKGAAPAKGAKAAAPAAAAKAAPAAKPAAKKK